MGISAVYQLLTAVAVAGNGPTIVVGSGGTYSYAIAGTFGGTSAKLQMIGPDGATFIDVPSIAAHTVNTLANIDLPAGARIRSVLTGGTPSAMNATLSFMR